MPEPMQITAILHDRADRKLNAKIRAAIEPLWSEFNKNKQGNEGHVQFTGEKDTAWIGGVYQRFCDGMFMAMQRAARDAEVHEFLSTVDRLSEEVGEVRQIVEQAQHYALQ